MRNYLPIARAALPFTSSKDQLWLRKQRFSQAKMWQRSTRLPRPKLRSTRSNKVTPSKKGARKTRSSVAAAAMPGPTDEEIRIRAYFISERRRRFALPGDAKSDWIEAKRH